MLLFISDSHFGQHGGRHIAEALEKEGYPLHFIENNLPESLDAEVWEKTSLLVLHLIAGTCNNPLPADPLCDEVLAYLQAGRPALLLHGSSAAFWHKDWWRRNVGFRWVRGGDPDDSVPSWHPVRPFRLERSKSTHPLVAQLEPIDFPEDEIYIELEQTGPAWTLLQVKTDEGTYPQAYINSNEWGGTMIGYLPGHKPHAVLQPANIANIRTLIDFLRQKA